MFAIDQRDIRQLCRFDPLARRFVAACLFGHRDDDEILLFYFVVQCLPHGQVMPTASPTRPRREQHALAAIIGQRMHSTREVG